MKFGKKSFGSYGIKEGKESSSRAYLYFIMFLCLSSCTNLHVEADILDDSCQVVINDFSIKSCNIITNASAEAVFTFSAVFVHSNQNCEGMEANLTARQYLGSESEILEILTFNQVDGVPVQGGAIYTELTGSAKLSIDPGDSNALELGLDVDGDGLQDATAFADCGGYNGEGNPDDGGGDIEDGIETIVKDFEGGIWQASDYLDSSIDTNGSTVFTAEFGVNEYVGKLNVNIIPLKSSGGGFEQSNLGAFTAPTVTVTYFLEDGTIDQETFSTFDGATTQTDVAPEDVNRIQVTGQLALGSSCLGIQALPEGGVDGNQNIQYSSTWDEAMLCSQ